MIKTDIHICNNTYFRKGGGSMKNYKSKEELLLKKIEDTRQKMLKTSTLYPLHSYEVVTISVELDNLLNEWESLYGKIEKQKF